MFQILPFGCSTHYIATAAAEGEDIKYIWSMMAVSLSEDDGKELLSLIAQEWTVLRGHAYRRAVIDSHKRKKAS